jgi:hypothetical protein
MPQNTPSTSPTLQNKITFDAIRADMRELGAQAGQGKDTQIKALLRAVEGGYHSALDLASNKHGADIDDATLLAEDYVKAQNGSVIFDAKAANQRKLVSTIRTSIKLGSWPKGGNGEPIATVQNLMTMRNNLRKVPAEAKKLNDAANTLLNYARTQLKRDTLIEDDELKSFCYKKPQEFASAEDIIERCAKQLEALVSGKAAHNTAQNNGKNVTDAARSLRKELAAIATARGQQGAPQTGRAPQARQQAPQPAPQPATTP